MNKKTQEKIQLAKSGANLYLINPRFTLNALANAAETDIDSVNEHFPNRQAVLDFFYESTLIEYQEVTRMIEDYMDYTLSEKLSNLALTLIGQMNEHKEFIRQTYRHYIICTSSEPAFNESFKLQLKLIYENDSNQSTLSSVLNNKYLYIVGLAHFHLLIKFWLTDDSLGYQKTMELIDKWTVFVQEVHYSAILDKGFDLSKFLFYTSPCKPFGTAPKTSKN